MVNEPNSTYTGLEFLEQSRGLEQFTKTTVINEPHGRAWCLFALDAERNGKVQRILAAISMCPALNSFSVFFNYFVNVCKI